MWGRNCKEWKVHEISNDLAIFAGKGQSVGGQFFEMFPERPKILCILFKYLGDVAVVVPALRSLRERFPEGELHILVPEDALPIVAHLPWIQGAWGLPRKRGSAKWRETLPLLMRLRGEQFDVSVDFVGNDRGALVSRVIGANVRIGLAAPLGFWGRRWCYTHPVNESEIQKENVHFTDQHLQLLEKVGVTRCKDTSLEVHPNPSLAGEASGYLAEGTVIGHLSTSQPKKEWPVKFWKDLYSRAIESGVPMCFASGPSPREQQLLADLREILPEAPILPEISGLGMYLAVLARARAFVSGDTGPLHFAAGLGVPTLGLFSATNAACWAPRGLIHRHLQGRACECSPHAAVCGIARGCMQSLAPDTVWNELQSLLALPQ